MLDGKKSYKLDKVRKPAANDIVLWNDFSKRTASELNMEFKTASKLKIPDGKHILSITDKDDIRYPGIVIEFKAINPKKETSLKETAESALRQIKEKDYDAELIRRGVKKENIRHYGFAFKGKEVLIEGV